MTAGSWYQATAHPAPPRPPLEGEARADVAIIGAGYTGLSAALHLAGHGLDVVLLEAESVGHGASGRNGGQVGTGQRREQDELESRYGKPAARRLWEIAEAAKALVRDLIARHHIDCDMKPGILHVAHKAALVPWCFEQAEKLRRDYGYDLIEPLDRTALAAHIGSERYHGGWYDKGGAHLHPLNYALGLARAAADAGVRIHEHSRVLSVRDGTPVRIGTAQGELAAKWLIFATNGYLGTLSPKLARHIMPIHNYIIATEPLGEARARSLLPSDAAVADTKFVIDYFRLTPDRRLLFGGGESYRRAFRDRIADFVRPFMLRVFPELEDVRITHGWGGTLAVTLNRMPHFGRLVPNILFAQGYSGHGVALATMAGKLLADEIAGRDARQDFALMAGLDIPAFPGGALLRAPAFILGMLYYALKDRF
ncbi:MAG: FAD-binding oxidoreductase [Rhodothalassiaceae bacterium]